MKPVYLHFTDTQGKKTKTFVATSLKTGVIDSLMDIATKGQELVGGGEEELAAAMEVIRDMKALLVRVFTGQFTLDELNDGAEHDEVQRVFMELIGSIQGGIKKK